jgi:hypothetical protein
MQKSGNLMTRELLVSFKSRNPRNPWLPLKTGVFPGVFSWRQLGDLFISAVGAKTEIETEKDLNSLNLNRKRVEVGLQLVSNEPL